MNFRIGELERLEYVQAYHMNDTCVILTRSATVDAYGLPVETFTAGTPIPCGYHMLGTREINENGQLVIVDAELRIERDTVIDNLDRIQITKRLGRTLASPETYRVIGDPNMGPSGIVLSLKRVEDG